MCMILVKKVRELAKLNPWAMHKRMGKKTVQSYLFLERTAKKLSLEEYFKLEQIFREAGCGTADQFRELAMKCQKKD